ncbi:MAG: DUF3662 domain-containing protein [Selenomonas sp.]|nr:DUF3662 domain-containing protein [Selenomonas sp.]
MGIGKWESFLENHIEGFFNKKFSSDLEPVELSKALEKEIARQGKGKAMRQVPNQYVFYLSKEDYQRLCAQRIMEELYTVAEKQVILQNYTLQGKLTVLCQADAEKQRGLFDLKSRFTEEEAPTKGCDEPDTLVLAKPKLGSRQPLNLPKELKLVSLKVVAGPDKDAYLEFGEGQIYIGRREKNEFILTDTKASRLHAWIAYENHRHVLYDAQSTNGTLVNGEPVESICLCSGDEIQIGTTLLLYEVI